MSDPHGPEDRRDEYGAVGTLERSKREAAQPKLGFFGWIRWAWRQLTTMRVALFLLLMLALAAVPASCSRSAYRIRQPSPTISMRTGKSAGSWTNSNCSM